MIHHERTDGSDATPDGPVDGRRSIPEERHLRGEGSLAAERRRALVAYLDGKRGDVASLVELVDHVAGRTGTGVEGVALALRYVHLPRLEAAGRLEYDRRSRTVRYRGTPARTGAAGEGP